MAGPLHTATDQWQSFEVRMRRRRVERCLIRAEIALEAGVVDDAREALEEARLLDPHSPRIAAIEQGLDKVPDAAEALPLARKTRMMVSIAACLAIATAGVAGWIVANRAGIESAATQASVPQGSAPATAPNPSQPADAPDAVVVSHELIRIGAAAVQESTAGTPSEETDTASTAPALPRLAEPAPPPSQLPPPPVNRGLDALSLPLPEPLSSPAVSEISAKIETERDAVPARLADANTVDETARVRAVLTQYESAYSALDATAARSVWPAVDARALARAFDSLASQRLALGRCDVNVSGLSATADCAGSATWKPKVGTGGRTEARRWTFDLRNADGDWHIVRITNH